MFISIYTQRFLGNWKGKFETGPNIILATTNAFVKFKESLTWKHVVSIQAIQPRSQWREAMRLAVIYQTRGNVFHRISKHWEVDWKFYLRWLNTVSSTYIWIGRYNHSLSLDASIMVPKKVWKNSVHGVQSHLKFSKIFSKKRIFSTKCYNNVRYFIKIFMFQVLLKM